MADLIEVWEVTHRRKARYGFVEHEVIAEYDNEDTAANLYAQYRYDPNTAYVFLTRVIEVRDTVHEFRGGLIDE